MVTRGLLKVHQDKILCAINDFSLSVICDKSTLESLLEFVPKKCASKSSTASRNFEHLTMEFTLKVEKLSFFMVIALVMLKTVDDKKMLCILSHKWPFAML